MCSRCPLDTLSVPSLLAMPTRHPPRILLAMPFDSCLGSSLDYLLRGLHFSLLVCLPRPYIALTDRGFFPRGQAMDIEWTTYSGNAVSGTATFVHWPYRAARWMGEFDRDAGSYKSKNESAVSKKRYTRSSVIPPPSWFFIPAMYGPHLPGFQSSAAVDTRDSSSLKSIYALPVVTDQTQQTGQQDNLSKKMNKNAIQGYRSP